MAATSARQRYSGRQARPALEHGLARMQGRDGSRMLQRRQAQHLRGHGSVAGEGISIFSAAARPVVALMIGSTDVEGDAVPVWGRPAASHPALTHISSLNCEEELT